MNSGATVTYTVTGTVSATASGTLTNTATVATPSGVTDPTPGNNSATDSEPIVGPDLAVTKQDGVTSIIQGGQVTYTLTVRNNGYATVSNAVFTDTVPATLTGVTWTCAGAGASCPAASGSGSISATIASLPNGAQLTYTLKGTVSSTATGSLTNTCTVTMPSGVTDSVPSNNTATDVDTITTATTTTAAPPGYGT